MKKLMLLSMIVVSCWASAALAATAGEWEGGGQAGVHVPNGDYSDFAKTGWIGGVLLDYGVTPMFTLGANLDYNASKAQDKFVTGPVSDINFSIMNYGAHGNLYLGQETSSIRPYLMGTLGAYQVREEIKSSLGNSDNTDTKFGFGGGLGAMMRPAGSSLGFGIEGAIHDISDAFHDPVTNDTKSALFYTVTGKITFSFSDQSQTGKTHY